MKHPLHAFEEFRASDGWPICPNCGQDRLESQLKQEEVLPITTIEAMEDPRGFTCGNCGQHYAMPQAVRTALNAVARASSLREDRKKPPVVEQPSLSASESPSESPSPSLPDPNPKPSRENPGRP